MLEMKTDGFKPPALRLTAVFTRFTYFLQGRRQEEKLQSGSQRRAPPWCSADRWRATWPIFGFGGTVVFGSIFICLWCDERSSTTQRFLYAGSKDNSHQFKWWCSLIEIQWHKHERLLQSEVCSSLAEIYDYILMEISSISAAQVFISSRHDLICCSLSFAGE